MFEPVQGCPHEQWTMLHEDDRGKLRGIVGGIDLHRNPGAGLCSAVGDPTWEDDWMSSATPFVRQQWMYDVRSACQTFYGMTLLAERHAVSDAFAWLRDALPPAVSVQERQALDDLLMVCFTRVGTAVHVNYHRRASGGCAGSPVEAAVATWAEPFADTRRRIDAWSRAFLSFLDSTHPSPPAERVAAVLHRSFQKPPSLDDLAHHAGTSRSALTRAFKARYGMTCREYVTRIRLRSFIGQVMGGQTAEDAARTVGYTRYHNLLDGVRARKLPPPKALRTLSHDSVRSILDDHLTLDSTREFASEAASGEAVGAAGKGLRRELAGRSD
jgi:AraC-like DNA-binding protein